MARLCHPFGQKPSNSARIWNKQVMDGLIKSDVLLSQSNGLVNGNISQNKDLFDFGNEDMPLVLEFLFPDEDFGSESIGCVCCESCQQKSQKFMNKTSRMLDQFRQQMFEMKDSVRKEMIDINKQLNQMSLMFAKLLLDVQIKLDKRNRQLDKVLDISKVLQHTNEYLLIENKHIKQKMEKVITENIKYRNKLGYDVRIVLNRNDCRNYLKKMALKKRLNQSKTKIITDSSTTSEVNVALSQEKSSIADPIDDFETPVRSFHQTISAVITATNHNNETYNQRSLDQTVALNSDETRGSLTSKAITPSVPLILHYNAIRKSPQKAITPKKQTSFESNSNGFVVNKANSMNDNSNQKIVEVYRQRLESEFKGFFNTYDTNNFNNRVNHNKNNKKRKINFFATDTSDRNAILPINGIVKSEPQKFSNLYRNQTTPLKDFSQYKDRNK